MSTLSPDQSLILPTDEDLGDVSTILDNYNDGVESRLVKRYESSVDRSVRNPAPDKGQVSYLIDTDVHERWDGSAWRNMRGGVDHFYLPGETGTVNLTFTSQISVTQQVFFTAAFSLTPAVMTNLSSSAGATTGWTTRAYNITTTSFFLFAQQVNSVSSSWSGIPVDWVAIGRQ